MDFDKTITDLNNAVRADKNIRQPWRNKAIARAEEAQAFIRMGKTSIVLEPPEDQRCICPVGGRRADCPVHQAKSDERGKTWQVQN